MRSPIVVVLVGWAILSCPVARADVAWVDWTSAEAGFSPGTALGTIAGVGGPIDVVYTGQMTTDTQVSGGVNYWQPDAAYLSATVPNGPPAADIMALIGGSGVLQTVTFSRPVNSPVMAIAGLGSINPPPTPYLFDRPFAILSSGGGYFGSPGFLGSNVGNVLQGLRGHGVIQFPGEVTSFSWQIPNIHSWTGFTVGVIVPEPSSFALAASWLVGMSTLVRMRALRIGRPPTRRRAFGRIPQGWQPVAARLSKASPRARCP